MKRFVFLYILMLTAVGVSAYDFEVAGVYYKMTSSDQVAVVHGDSPYTGFCSVPSSVSYGGHVYQVVEIGDNAFRNSLELVGVNLPSTIKQIGNAAFSNCIRLGAVSLPGELTTIGNEAFYDCRSLYRLAIPASVTSIGDEAFARCTSLLSFQVHADNPNYSSPDGVLMDKARTCLIAYPNGHGSSYEIPAGVKEIGAWAFLGCSSLSGVTLPQGLQTIKNAAFYGCSGLKTVAVPNSVTTIGVWAFSECSSLETISLGSGVAEIGEGAFSFCSALQSIRVSSNSHYVSVDGALLTKDQKMLVACPGAVSGVYVIPSTVQTIDNQAFYGCNTLKSVILPTALSELGDNPFVFCDNLTQIMVSDDNPGYKSLNGVLLNKDLTDIVFFPNGKSGSYIIPTGVTDLHCGTFLRSQQLNSVTIPEGVVSIGDWTFMDCEGLQSVTLPTTLSYLGDRAFDCPSLQTVICSAQPMQTTAFSGSDFLRTTLYMPKGSENEFQQAVGWDVFGSYKPFGLYIKNGEEAVSGQSGRISVYTTGPLHLSRVQTEIHLPSVLDMQTKQDGTYHVDLAPGVAGTVSCTKNADGTYLVTIDMNDQRTLAENADLLFSLYTDCRPDTEEGIYELRLQNTAINYVSSLHSGSAVQPAQSVYVYVSEASGIQTVAVDKKLGAIYSLQGQQVRTSGASPSGLPAGVYIINGKKVLISK